MELEGTLYSPQFSPELVCISAGVSVEVSAVSTSAVIREPLNCGIDIQLKT